MPASRSRGIQPTELCRQKAILSQARRARGPGAQRKACAPILWRSAATQIETPLVPAALELNDLAQSGTSVVQWANYNWNMGWWESSSRSLQTSVHFHRKCSSPKLHGPSSIAFEQTFGYAVIVNYIVKEVVVFNGQFKDANKTMHTLYMLNLVPCGEQLKQSWAMHKFCKFHNCVT